jgi:uncharacterized NAD-dependent epimerase/dehydratase family protein
MLCPTLDAGRSPHRIQEDEQMDKVPPEGNAIVYCEGAFNTTNGKTAHGLVRRSRRYSVLAVVDSRYAGKDAGDVLDGTPNGIPIESDLMLAARHALDSDQQATHLVIGLAPDGGRLPEAALADVKRAICLGLNIDSGLHDFLSDDEEIMSLAGAHKVEIRDVRKPPSRDDLHFFSSKISEVQCLKVAVLGTDSAVGKRTTAWCLVDALEAAGLTVEMVGTGQTAWMQGARYTIILDSLINDFVAGEIEHAVWSAWNEQLPDAIIIEGQGSLMNPAYPGGFEILAAGRPDAVVLQHAPARTEYDGFPGHTMHPLTQQIQAIELISGRPVVAVTINHEGLLPEEIEPACEAITRETGLPAYDVLRDGAGALAKALCQRFNRKAAVAS